MLLIYQHEIIIINHKKKTGRVAFRGGAWAAAPCRATGPRGCAARRRCPAGPAGRPGWPPAALRAHVRRRRGCVSVGKNGVFFIGENWNGMDGVSPIWNCPFPICTPALFLHSIKTSSTKYISSMDNHGVFSCTSFHQKMKTQYSVSETSVLKNFIGINFPKILKNDKPEASVVHNGTISLPSSTHL